MYALKYSVTHCAHCHEPHTSMTICIRNFGTELPEDLTGFGYRHVIPSGQTRLILPSQRTHKDLQRDLNYTHSQTYFVSSYVFCPNTQHIKPRAKIRKREAERVFQLLNSHVQLSLKHPKQIWKRSAVQKAEDSEETEPKETLDTVTVLNKGPGLTEVGSEVSVAADSKEWRSAATGR